MGTALRNITLKQLRALAAVAKGGTIASASKVLGVTPPAVALQLKLLEESVGLPLFDRSQQGLRPTDAGVYMLETHARVAAALQDCEEGLRQIKGLSASRVSIGAVSTSKYFAPVALAAFAHRNPGVRLELLVGNRDETIEALRRFSIDIAIMGRPPSSIEVEFREIGAHPHVIIAQPGHRLASRRRLSLAMLKDEMFLLREPGSGTRILADKTFAKSDVAPKREMEFGSNETIKQAVMAGLGIAFISAHTIASELLAGRLTVLDVRGLPIMRKWYVIRAKAKNLMPAGRALWEFLAGEGGSYLPDVASLLVCKGAKAV